MKKLLLGSVALIAMSATPVLAADMPVRAIAPAWSWNGCYAGLNVGYAWARFEKTGFTGVNQFTGAPIAGSPFGDFDFDDDGATGGVQVGCNWQTGYWIWGVETDLQLTSIEARNYFDNSLFGFTGLATPVDTDVHSRLRYFGTVRGRIGWTITPEAFLYVTGGFAYGHVNSVLAVGSAAGSFAGNVAFDSKDHYGYTVGVGAEAKIARNFSAKIEYLYVDLGSQDYQFLNLAGATIPRITYAWDQRVDFHVVRVGLNYQWDWYSTGWGLGKGKGKAPAVVAKY